MKVYCKDCKCYKLDPLFKIMGCRIEKEWFFVGLNPHNECAYYCKKWEWGGKKTSNFFIGVFKTLGFIYCFAVGWAVSEWSISGEPEDGWALWRPVLYIVLSIGCFLMSKYYFKWVMNEEKQNANNKISL